MVRASGPETALICGPIGRSGNAALNAGIRPIVGRRPVHAAGVGGIADRAGDIGAVRDVPDAGRDRGARTTGRAARRDAGIARILGVAVDQVGGEPAIGKRRAVGPAEHARRRPSRRLSTTGLLALAMTSRCSFEAVGGGKALLVDIDLDR